MYQVSGNFKKEEAITINGVDNGRVITEVRDYGLSDVHQIAADNTSGGIGKFTADPLLSNKIN